MEHNVGKWDKTVRIGVGITLLIVGFLSPKVSGAVQWVLIALGIILTITGVIGFCPVYKVCKISTAKVSDADVKDLLK